MGKITFHSLGFHTTKKEVVAGHILGRTFQADSFQKQDIARNFLLLVDDDAALTVESHIGL